MRLHEILSNKKNINESIMIGDINSSDVVYAYTVKNNKYVVLIGGTNFKTMPHAYVKCYPNKSLIEKIVKSIKDTDIEGENIYSVIDKYNKNLYNIEYSIDEFTIEPEHREGMVFPENFSIIAKEMLKQKMDDKTPLHDLISHMMKGVFYGGKSFNDKDRTNKDLLIDHIYKLSNDNEISTTLSITSIDYFIINNIDRTITVVDSTKKYSSRIETIEGRRQYIIPINDLSIDERSLVHMLKELSKKNDDLLTYKVHDNFINVPVEYTVNDVINGIGRIADNANQVDKQLKNKEFVVYHGTSLATYKNQISKYGLKPNQGTDYIDKIAGHSENNVYLTHSLPEARKYATRAGGAAGSVVLEVTIRDTSKIKFDEDYLGHAWSNMPKNVYQEVKMRLMQLWPEMSNKILRYKTDVMGILDNPIETHTVRTLFDKVENKAQKNILDLIGNYAIAKDIKNFSYSGNIPVKDIKVIEQFKSSSTKDDDDKYDEKYDKTINSFKK